MLSAFGLFAAGAKAKNNPNRRKSRRGRIYFVAFAAPALFIVALILINHMTGLAQEPSDDVLLVDHGALYPALQRLETKEWISAKWGTSSNDRKARFYSLTKSGRRQLAHETSRWRKLAAAIGRVLGSEIIEG